MITAQQVADAQFDEAKDTAGFDVFAVDEFLDRVVETLEKLDRNEKLPADALTSTAVVETEFPEVRGVQPGGYDMDQVDDLLDLVAQRLYIYENESAGAAPADTPSAGTEGTETVGNADSVAPAAAVTATDTSEQIRDEDLPTGPAEGQDVLFDEPNAGEDVRATDDVRAGDEKNHHGLGTAAVGTAAAGTLGAGYAASKRHDEHVEAAPSEGTTSASSENVPSENVSSGAVPAEQTSFEAAQPETAQQISDTSHDTATAGSTHDIAADETALFVPATDETAAQHVEATPAQPVVASTGNDEVEGITPTTTDENVISYPATDHRVPLPTGTPSSKLTEADVEASANYHPEYSEYAAPEAVETDDAVREDELRTARQEARDDVAADQFGANSVDAEPGVADQPEVIEQSKVARDEAPVVSEAAAAAGAMLNGAESVTAEREAAKASLPMRDASTGERTDAVATPAAQPDGAAANEPVVEKPVVDAPAVKEVTATERVDEAVVEQPSAHEPVAVERPEPIDRPQPIDQAREIPKREDRSKKGFFRRLFGG